MKSWFSIKAQTATDPAEVSIYGDIGSWGINAAAFIDSVKAVQGPIRVRINSGGGDVFDGLAMYNYLASRGNVETVIDGLAASAASLPFLAGNKRVIPKSAFLMIHNPWSGAVGNAAEMRKAADVLDRIGQGLADVYARVTGMAIDAVKSIMDAETWLNGEAALAGKWATEIVDLGPVKASVRPGRYAKAPAEILAAAPGELMPGDYVELSYADSTTKGEVADILTAGTVNGADGSVEASESDPGAIVTVLKEVDGTGQFTETEVQVARLLSTLTRVEPPVIVETEGDGMDAKAKLSAPKSGAGNQQKPMSKTAKLLALLGVQPAAEDAFLASAIADLGVTPEAVTEARKAGTTDFLATHISDRIAKADADAKASVDRLNAIVAAVGIKPDAADIAAEIKAAIETKAAAKAAELLASKGFSPKALANATSPKPAGELRGLALAMEANRIKHANLSRNN